MTQDKFQDWAALAGRAALAWLFVPAGLQKLMNFSGTAGYIASQGVPLPEVAAVIAIVAELGLGLALLIGWRARWAALGLAIFVAVITPIFHNYWDVQGPGAMMQQINFNKNVAVVGGLLALAAFGVGGLSLDRRRRAT